MPLQPNGCDWVFVLKYTEKITEDPELFLSKLGSPHGFDDWFEPIVVSTMRSKLARIIRELAEIEGNSSMIPEVDFDKVRCV